MAKSTVPPHIKALIQQADELLREARKHGPSSELSRIAARKAQQLYSEALELQMAAAGLWGAS